MAYRQPILQQSVTAFLKCGDLQEDFAPTCCPDCQQKRTLLTAVLVAEEVCAPVAHRQVALTIPSRLRVRIRNT